MQDMKAGTASDTRPPRGWGSPSWRARRLRWLTRETFAAAVLAAEQGDDWRAVSAGRGGVAFFLTSDPSRRARLLLEKDCEPLLIFGALEIGLCELPGGTLPAWINHLGAARDAHPCDAALLRKLWRALEL